MTDLVALLTGPRAADLLQGALTGTPGAQLPGFTCAVDEVHDRVGAETSVTYHVSYDVGGARHADYLVVTTADVEAAATVTVEDVPIRVWRHPDDPRLPGLAGACTPEVLREWLPGAQTDPDVTDVLVYRPLRRAVLRTERGADMWFTKVVRPDRGELLERRHALLDGIGPDVVARPEPGVLVTARVPGQPLAVALSAWQIGESSDEPDPADAVALLDRLPDGLLDLPPRPSWTDRADFHGAMAAAALPDHAEEIGVLTEEIRRLADEHPVGPVVPTHGDFYEANIFCEGGRASRLVDVDTAGPGRREDDLACLVAHLAVLADLSPEHYPDGAAVCDRWASYVEREVHPGAFRVRVAGVLLSLVARAPRSVALARLDLARAWVWRAGLTASAAPRA